MIPLRFEYIHERFTGFGEKRFVTILGYHTHHYTGEKFIRIREESESGFVQEFMVNQDAMNKMLSKRVEV